jgi:hypothetical protein
MRDVRWNDVLKAARAAALHFRAAQGLFHQDRFNEGGNIGYRHRMAFRHAMLSGHTALEDTLLRLLAMLGDGPPTGSNWPFELIDRASRHAPGEHPAILDPSLAAAARETRSFRHFVMHDYRDELEPQRAKRALGTGLLIADQLEAAVINFAEDCRLDRGTGSVENGLGT